MKRRRIAVSLGDILANKLEEVTASSGLNASEIVRAALNEYLKKKAV
jgi:metal-responsive CopG/Arc/MetJ family transcriptional regulator